MKRKGKAAGSGNSFGTEGDGGTTQHESSPDKNRDAKTGHIKVNCIFSCIHAFLRGIAPKDFGGAPSNGTHPLDED